MANKVETLVASCPVKASADMFYEFFKNKTSEIINIFPAGFKEIKVIEGEQGTEGSVTLWTYTVGNITVTEKLKTEAVDDAARSITLTVTEGELLALYKSFKFVLNFAEGLTKVSFTYEKAGLLSPPPVAYVPLAVALFTLIDAYLLINNDQN